MGYVHINDLLLDPTFMLKEHVEKYGNIVIKKMESNKEKRTLKKTYAEAVKTRS